MMRAASVLSFLIALAAPGMNDARAAGRDDGNPPQDIGRPLDRYGRGETEEDASAPAKPRAYYPPFWADSPFQLRRADPYKRYRPRLLDLR